MPVNDMYPLSELKAALLSFRKKTNYRITFEYVMIDDFNMGSEDIKALTKFCGDISCKVNLIKWNDVVARHALPVQLKSPSDKKVEAFIEKLQKLPFAITYRKSRGADIAGACGQLAGLL
jgi:23S rRNA (adenine2503-C2)-methyltransferase